MNTTAEKTVALKVGFFSPVLRTTAQRNAREYRWAREKYDGFMQGAETWVTQSDDELWNSVVGPSPTRSHMVLSNGMCPACRADVPMYDWQIDARLHPWKLRCPHCNELFPKNDFERYYNSGLDAAGVWRSDLADDSLLLNVDHPVPDDPLHEFGVDDGEGFVEAECGVIRRWRFAGTYLIYGQWRQVVLAGIRNLSQAYAVSGELIYAHKAAILLDRVADFYPDYDHETQSWLYETLRSRGYVSTWHDSCEETRELALAYDRIAEALDDTTLLVDFLCGKAREAGLENLKLSADDIRSNIEERILRDALSHPSKISSNYPRTELTCIIIRKILGDSDTAIASSIDAMFARATAIDGVTGESGLSGYTAWTLHGIARFLAEFDRCQPGFLAEAIERHPSLKSTYRFHIDTFCLGRYYPQCGDAGSFATPTDKYMGVEFAPQACRSRTGFHEWNLMPSMHTFLWRLYEATGDEAYVQVMVKENGGTTNGLPLDLFARDVKGIQHGIAAVMERAAGVPTLKSRNLESWHLAILRSGEGDAARAAYINYGVGRSHSHFDALNLGLYAKGLDLMPDFGYPPVHLGGWGSERANWFAQMAAHNTVTVDGANPTVYGQEFSATTTLWTAEPPFQAIQLSGPEMIGGDQYERTVALIDVSPEAFYLIDGFRVGGGHEHTRWMQSHYGSLTVSGLSPHTVTDRATRATMRNFRMDSCARPPWQAEWTIADKLRLLPSQRDIRLRVTDFTAGATAGTCEGWIADALNPQAAEEWIPRLFVERRDGDKPLRSNFVCLIEPFENEAVVTRAHRYPLHTPGGRPLTDSDFALVVFLRDGRRDVFVSRDMENPLGLGSGGNNSLCVLPEESLQFDGDLLWLRFGIDGTIERLVTSNARLLAIGQKIYEVPNDNAVWHGP